ncbi:EcoAI/FtnUII family type I restriction enzme subunit R, partial [Chromatium okenii]|uniref:EcoAI/FtnUII family type I restriction enzme subunit R n=1 Tax=Chromatium okenii TaxID=61644 RepID=UPI0026E98F63
ADYIDPALKAAGWSVIPDSRIRREYPITLGRLQGTGKRAQPLFADYVLEYRNHKLAVIEAKAWHEAFTKGVGQVKDYADKLEVRFAYATNGQGIYQIDMRTGVEGEIQRYPTPQELWDLTFNQHNVWHERFAAIPFEDRGGYFQPRYYQDIAIKKVLTVITAGQDRILLTLATGTGKTFIAFQIAWVLFQSRWNLHAWKHHNRVTRRPRILFLADRNILANQAYNAFSAFPEDALIRIEPADIRKKGKVPKNGNLFFTIFQTFMSGAAADGQLVPYFGDYSPDFFDVIIVDECHRGGANDESSWRGILDYFTPAVQLGLTATPKRKDNVDTYAYFGEPVFIYSLKDGINDGFLTPFRVKQITTTLDEYCYTADDLVLEGQVDTDKTYQINDFNRIIEIREREAYLVSLFMAQIKPYEKTLVFCANQGHALIIRDLINQNKVSNDPQYCQRVTADEGALGEQYLRDFQDNEKTIPTILTTSHKLSTGVDARNIRHIVLLRPIKSMIEFKQIIGRGTRLYEGKEYFTVYDFVQAHQHFNDPEWDGEPIEPVSGSRRPREGVQEPAPPCYLCGQRPCVCQCKLKVKLADDKVRTLQHQMATSFWHQDGTPMSAQQFLEVLFGTLPAFFNDETQLRTLWSAPDTRRKLLDGLAEKGFGKEQLFEMQQLINAEKSDLFDVLAHVAYATQPLTREERVGRAMAQISAIFNSQQQVFLDFVLSHYVDLGVDELDEKKLTPLLLLKYNSSLTDAIDNLGQPDEIRRVFNGFQKYLY